MKIVSNVQGRETTLSWEEFSAQFLGRTSLEPVEILGMELSRPITFPQGSAANMAAFVAERRSNHGY